MSGLYGNPPCSDIIAANSCPLGSSTGCNAPGNRVRVLQHGCFRTNLNADWIPSQKRVVALPSLLDLPREIRDTIYEYLVPTSQHIELGGLHVDFDQKVSHVHPRSHQINPAPWTALLRISKQLHHEVAARFYGANVFSISCAIRAMDLDDLATRALAAVGFAGLVPLHPAYIRFLRGIGIRSSLDNCYDIHSVFDPVSSATIPGPGLIHRDLKPPPIASEEAITTFIRTTQTAIDALTTCSCLRLIPLGDGTYTIRRPPSASRARCKSTAWKDVQTSCGSEIERMRQGEFRGLRNRRHRGGCAPLPMWFCGLMLCCACLTCCAPLWWETVGQWWEKLVEWTKKRARQWRWGERNVLWRSRVREVDEEVGAVMR